MFYATEREGEYLMPRLRIPLRLRLFFRRITPLLRGTTLLTLGICILIAGASLSWPFSPPAVTVFSPSGEIDESGEKGDNGNVSLFKSLPFDARLILAHGLPLFSHIQKQKGNALHLRGRDFWDWFVGRLTRIDITDPRKIIIDQVPVLGRAGILKSDGEGLPPQYRREVATVNPTPSPSQPKPLPRPDGEPRVAIFHTHTSETFLPLHGVAHIYDQTSGIVLAGKILARELEGRGICVLHDQTPHDFEVHREAYGRSAKTVAGILRDHPKLELIIDLHRDAPNVPAPESRAITTTKVAGKDVAGILLVVGTDGLGLEHPNWRDNHGFAQQIHEGLENMYPGLSRGLRTSSARYNQHLFPRMILVEMGGVENNMEEITLGVKHLAAVLAAILE
ncbi:MAG: stage II sporulation protein P [Firmicutes bacterium]|nr:stage II sporulation protein P [Bacillota bacterium]